MHLLSDYTSVEVLFDMRRRGEKAVVTLTITLITSMLGSSISSTTL